VQYAEPVGGLQTAGDRLGHGQELGQRQAPAEVVEILVQADAGEVVHHQVGAALACRVGEAVGVQGQHQVGVGRGQATQHRGLAEQLGRLAFQSLGVQTLDHHLGAVLVEVLAEDGGPGAAHAQDADRLVLVGGEGAAGRVESDRLAQRRQRLVGRVAFQVRPHFLKQEGCTFVRCGAEGHAVGADDTGLGEAAGLD
jgi:hypothetical protein